MYPKVIRCNPHYNSTTDMKNIRHSILGTSLMLVIWLTASFTTQSQLPAKSTPKPTPTVKVETDSTDDQSSTSPSTSKEVTQKTRVTPLTDPMVIQP